MAKIFPGPEQYPADRLKALHAEALKAIETLNRALGHAAPLAILQAGLANDPALRREMVLAHSKELDVKPKASTPEAVVRHIPLTRREELIEIARAGGMSEDRIAKRFGPDVVATTGKPARPVAAVPSDKTKPLPGLASIALPALPSFPGLELPPLRSALALDSSGVPF